MFREPGGDVVLTDYGMGRIANVGVGIAVDAGTPTGNVFILAPELIRMRCVNTFASDV